MSVHYAAHSLHVIARDKRLILTTSASSYTPQLILTTSASSHTPQLNLITSASPYTPTAAAATHLAEQPRPRASSTARTFVFRSAASEVTETPTRAPAPCAALHACVASHTQCTTPEGHPIPQLLAAHHHATPHFHAHRAPSGRSKSTCRRSSWSRSSLGSSPPGRLRSS